MLTAEGVLEDRLLFSKSVDFTPLKVDGSRRLIAGYANVSGVKDSQGDIVSREALERAWAKFSSNPKFCVSQLFHSNIPIASILLESVTDSSGAVHKSGVDERGLYVVAEIRSDIKVADEVWGKIVKGEIRGFSIGGEYLEQPKTQCVNGECHNSVENIELHEVSIVNNPANPVSFFSILKDDSFAKLSELTNRIQDSVVKEGAVQVSKRPYSNGKFGVFVTGDLPLPEMGEGFMVVKEKCPNNEWVTLFDLALLRPYTLSVKSEAFAEHRTSEVLSGSAPVGSKGSPLSDKPQSEGVTPLSEPEVKREETVSVAPATEVGTDANASSDVAPPVEEKPVEIAPMTVETLAADVAQLKEVVKGLVAKLSPPVAESTPSIVKGEDYPWDKCVSDRIAEGKSQESADKICGAIRAGTVRHKGEGVEAEWDALIKSFEPKMEKSATSAVSAVPGQTGVAQPAIPAPIIPPSTAPMVEASKPEPVAASSTPTPEAKVVVKGIAPTPVAEPSMMDALAKLYKTSWKKVHDGVE